MIIIVTIKIITIIVTIKIIIITMIKIIIIISTIKIIIITIIVTIQIIFITIIIIVIVTVKIIIPQLICVSLCFDVSSAAAHAFYRLTSNGERRHIIEALMIDQPRKKTNKNKKTTFCFGFALVWYN